MINCNGFSPLRKGMIFCLPKSWFYEILLLIKFLFDWALITGVNCIQYYRWKLECVKIFHFILVTFPSFFNFSAKNVVSEKGRRLTTIRKIIRRRLTRIRIGKRSRTIKSFSCKEKTLSLPFWGEVQISNPRKFFEQLNKCHPNTWVHIKLIHKTTSSIQWVTRGWQTIWDLLQHY